MSIIIFKKDKYPINSIITKVPIKAFTSDTRMFSTDSKGYIDVIIDRCGLGYMPHGDPYYDKREPYKSYKRISYEQIYLGGE